MMMMVLVIHFLAVAVSAFFASASNWVSTAGWSGGREFGTGGDGRRVPAACFSRIFCAATSFALASSLPLKPWAFFCKNAIRLSEAGFDSVGVVPGCGPPRQRKAYRAGLLLQVRLAGLVALVSTSHVDAGSGFGLALDAVRYGDSSVVRASRMRKVCGVRRVDEWGVFAVSTQLGIREGRLGITCCQLAPDEAVLPHLNRKSCSALPRVGL